MFNQIQKRERNKTKCRLLIKRSFGMLVLFPFSAISLDSSLGIEPACRIDKL